MDIICQQCGAANRLGVIFCRECGAKLDLNAMDPNRAGKGRGARRRASSGGGVKLIARLIRLLVLLGLVGILGLLCWGEPAPGDAPRGDGREVMNTLGALRQAVLRGNEVEASLPEADINGYINARVSAAGSGALSMTLDAVSVDFRDGQVTAWLGTRLGPVPITYTAEVAIGKDASGRMTFEAGRIAIGRLAMPAFLKDRVTGQFNAVFSGFRDERVLLDRLPRVASTDGALELGTIKR